ncbi:MAG: GNAT family N-acetyltransferase [Lacisediminihabitans sp.]
MSIDEPQFLIQRSDAKRRYELTLGREHVGYILYHDDGETRVFVHTEVEPDYAGHGLATQLIEWALDDVRGAGKHIRSECAMVSSYLKKHPGFEDLLEPDA